jgi:CRISPR-associated endoribonuclease Cas6
MPISTVLTLECLSPARIDQFTGRGVHGFWFQRWHLVDPATGDRLHQESQESPFTLSPLLGLPPARRGETTIQKGQTAWLRITCLGDALGTAFTEKWLKDLQNSVPLDDRGGNPSGGNPSSTIEIPEGLQWKVNGILQESGSHPWAASIPYEELSRSHLMNSNPPRQWRLEFVTPTTFNTGRTTEGRDHHLPFPLPESLLKSWLRRWQAFAPLALPEEELLGWVRSNLAVSAYHLHTLPVREGEHLRLGCVGSLTLRALDMPPYLRAAVDLLAAYSFYCGSGGHTAQGMGQTRLVNSR